MPESCLYSVKEVTVAILVSPILLGTYCMTNWQQHDYCKVNSGVLCYVDFKNGYFAHFGIAINGAEKGELVAMLLSPTISSPIPASVDSSRHANGSLFTIFLTAPLQAFLLLLGFTGSEIEMKSGFQAMYSKAENLLSSSLNHWGSMLAASDNLDPVWAQVLSDPFLRRLLLRFMFCRVVLSLYAPTFNKTEFLPECMPCLPEDVLPMSTTSQTTVLQIADIFGATNKFIFSEGIMLSPSGHTNEESISS
ncbi:unnamed protein product [Ilex paraguariensis]|uniref:Uncharacterized protein n=1 Tax=Ilex paraguariensis TaxID=185542 RepID=A0ABC8RJ73_9AQUA